jgi:hypothetical protein
MSSVAGHAPPAPAAIGIGRVAEVIGDQLELCRCGDGVRTRRSSSSAKRFMGAPLALKALPAGEKSSDATGRGLFPKRTFSNPPRPHSRQMQRPGLDALEFAPAHQRLLAAMGDPDLAGAGARRSFRSARPSRQWSEMISGSSTPPCLARWRTIIQPEAKAGADREAPRPAIGEGRWRADDDGAGEIGLVCRLDGCRLEVAKRDALPLVIFAEPVQAPWM